MLSHAANFIYSPRVELWQKLLKYKIQNLTNKIINWL